MSYIQLTDVQNFKPEQFGTLTMGPTDPKKILADVP